MLMKSLLWSIIKNNKFIFISMVLLSTLSFSLLLGLVSSYSSLDKYYNKYFSDYGYPNGFITTDITEKSSFDVLQEVEGIKELNIRYSYNVSLDLDGRKIASRVITYNDDSFYELYILEQGEVSKDLPKVAVYKEFADYNNLQMGDTIKLGLNGEYYDFVINQIVRSPDGLYTKAYPNIPNDTIDFGCVYIDECELRPFLDSIESSYVMDYANQAVFLVKDGYSKDEVLENCVKKIENQVEVLDNCTDDDSWSKWFITDSLDAFKTLSYVLPGVFFFITIIMIFLFLMQIIKYSYREIGILMALGYKKRNILLIFSLLSFTVSLISIVLGSLLGKLLGNGVAFLYSSTFQLPPFETEFSSELMLLAVITIIIVCQLASLLNLFVIRKASPQSTMVDYTEAMKTPPRSLMKILAKLPLSGQIIFSFIFQNLQRFLVSICSLFAAFVMIFAALSVNNSVKTILDQYLNGILNFDAQTYVIQANDVNTNDFNESLKELDFVEHSEIIKYAKPEITANNVQTDALLVGINDGHRFMQIPNLDNSASVSNIPKDGIILDASVAKKLEVDVGDYVSIGDVSLQITELCDVYQTQMQFVSMETFEKLNIKSYDSFLININNENALLNHLSDSDLTSFTVFTNKYSIDINNRKRPIMYATYILIIFAIFIGFFNIVITNQSGLRDQKRKLSIMRLLGYKTSNIAKLWLYQSFIHLIVAISIGIPCGIEFSKYVLKAMSADSQDFPFVNSPEIYLFSIALVVAFDILISLFAMIIVKRFNISENTKSRE